MTRRSTAKAKQGSAAPPAPAVPKIPPAQVLPRLAALQAATAQELKEQWRALLGKEPPPFNRPYLVSRLSYRVQELAYGGLKPETRARLEALGEQLDGGNVVLRRIRADSRPLPGTRLVRERATPPNAVQHEVWRMNQGDENIVQRVWALCHILRGDGISYHQYVSELTYLLFLKIAEETGAETLLPDGYRWRDLAEYKRSDLLPFYQEMLTHLGGHATSKVVREIYAFPTTVFSHSENLRAVIDGIAKIEWHAVSKDRIGDIYEGLLAKSSQDARSGAGQYFTPRPLVDSIVRAAKPSPGELIQDPATGSGGFLISADQYVRANSTAAAYSAAPPRYQGIEIEKSTYRICLMNTFVHGLDVDIRLGDALTEDALALEPADLILANPPFGARAGSRRKHRSDLEIATTNKQLAFLQHIYLGLKPGGRAAVVMPDNVLFEGGAGRRIRQTLMALCDLHTILRLPQGIFYSAGVQTNVLFFTRHRSDAGATQTISFYDMRTAAPRYGRKRPLLASDFVEFERTYAERPSRQDVPSNRWRSFSRAEIAARDDDLNVAWLQPDDVPGESEASDPLAVLATMTDHLRSALDEAEVLAEELAALASAEAEA